MDTHYYVVRVQDYGDVYEDKFSALEGARYLMTVERLPCSLWECDPLSGNRCLLDSRNTAEKQAV